MLVTPRGLKLNEARHVTVKFNKAGVRQLADAAATRSRGSRSNGYYDGRVTRAHTSEEIDVLGAAGEFAAAAYLGLRVRVNGDRDPGHDLVLATGHTVDVKTSFREDAPLRFRTKPKADYALLVVRVSDCEYRIVGWTDHPRVGSMAQSRLKPPSELRELHLNALNRE